MLLTIKERFAISSLLPSQGDILTLKDLRILREDLAVSQEDRKEVQFFTEFKCPKCAIGDVFPAPVKCGICDAWMRPTGQVGCSNWDFTKEIAIPDYLFEVIITTLKRMNDHKQLKESHIGIYDRFVGSKEPTPKEKQS